MPNKNLIEKKIAEILKQLEFLKEIVKFTENELFGSPYNLYFSERVIERLIISAVDINMHLLSDLTGSVSAKYYDSFIGLANLEVYSMEFAQNIAKSTTLRNLIAHEYMSIDPEIYYKSLNFALIEFTKYVEYIQDFIEKH